MQVSNHDTRHGEMLEHAVEFHVAHPEVWHLFCRHAFALAEKHNRCSVTYIFEKIRWDTPLGDKWPNGFKINNNHKAFYARWFMERFPAYDGFFRVRQQTSEWLPATHLPPLTPEFFDNIGVDPNQIDMLV